MGGGTQRRTERASRGRSPIRGTVSRSSGRTSPSSSSPSYSLLITRPTLLSNQVKDQILEEVESVPNRVILTLTTTSLSNPTNPRFQTCWTEKELTSQPHTGQPGGVFLCSQPRWRGTCKWWPSMEQCTNYPRTSAEEANKAPVSVGPDWGGYCEIFGKTGCEEKEGPGF